MTRNRTLQMLRTLAVLVFTAGASGMSAAHGGGGGGGFSGGDSGDSSMNPFTGDSYAYFHGGHNLGEQGTIRPNRPNPAWSAQKATDANRNAAAKAPAQGSAAPQAQASPAQKSDATEPSASR